MSENFFDYFHKDTNRTFPQSEISHMSKILDLSHSNNDDAPFLLANISDMMQTGAVADTIKALVFYGKEKDVQTTFNELIAPITDDAIMGMSDQMVHLLHGLLGISSETAELASAVLTGWTNDLVFDETNIKEEIGDILVYAALICNQFGFTLEDAMNSNIAKRAKRFPDGFSKFHATNRDLDGERDILEGNHE